MTQKERIDFLLGKIDSKEKLQKLINYYLSQIGYYLEYITDYMYKSAIRCLKREWHRYPEKNFAYAAWRCRIIYNYYKDVYDDMKDEDMFHLAGLITEEEKEKLKK